MILKIGISIEIWKTYLQKKNFPPTFELSDLFKVDPESKFIIELYDYDELVAFSIIRNKPGPVSLQFAWTYHEPKLSLGTHCQYFELHYLKDSGCEYIIFALVMKNLFGSPGSRFEFWTTALGQRPLRKL